MRLTLYPFILLLLLSFLIAPGRAASQASTTVVVDDEYEVYKKKGDDFFKAGRYLEARRQYQNCLEVPGFENDAYAKTQIEKSSTGLTLRQQADEALRQGKDAEGVSLYTQLLTLNADDAQTKAQLAEYYEREGNKLYSQHKYAEAKTLYTQALNYTTRQETLRLQIRNSEENLKPRSPVFVQKPSKRVGLKVFTGAVAVGAGAYALLLRRDFQTKTSTLNQLGQTVDPGGTGVIDNPDTYRQYNEAYTAAEAAQQKNGLYKACLGVAAVATVAELYLLLHKPKPRATALQWQPSSHGWGLAARYTF